MFIKNHYQMNAPESITFSASQLPESSHEFSDHDDVICLSNQTDGTVDLYVKTQIGDHIVHDTVLTLMQGQESACTRATCGALKGHGPVYFSSSSTQGHFVITTFRSKATQ